MVFQDAALLSYPAGYNNLLRTASLLAGNKIFDSNKQLQQIYLHLQPHTANPTIKQHYLPSHHHSLNLIQRNEPAIMITF